VPNAKTKLPSHTELCLPLLEAIDDAGGTARPGDIYDVVASKLGISDEVRNAAVTYRGSKQTNLIEQRMRWVRQTLVAKGYMTASERGVWGLTEKAHARLKNCVRGTIVTVLETHRGFVLWARSVIPLRPDRP
jgi:hypothetical protein